MILRTELNAANCAEESLLNSTILLRYHSSNPIFGEGKGKEGKRKGSERALLGNQRTDLLRQHLDQRIAGLEKTVHLINTDPFNM